MTVRIYKPKGVPPPLAFEALKLHREGGLDRPEIAKRLGLSRSTVDRYILWAHEERRPPPSS